MGRFEICIGRDEDGVWWAVLMVDDDQVLWHGPYIDRPAAEKAGFNLAEKIEHLDDDAIRRIAEKSLPTLH
jgi:hypothetical protein